MVPADTKPRIRSQSDAAAETGNNSDRSDARLAGQLIQLA